MKTGPKTQFFPAACVILRWDGRILLVSRTNTGFMDGFYSLPGGRVEPDEPYQTAAQREALEEAGVQVALKDLHYVHTNQRHHGSGDTWVDTYFEARKWQGEPYNAEPEVHGEVAWFPLNKLPYRQILPYQAAVLKAIARGLGYSELGFPGDPRQV